MPYFVAQNSETKELWTVRAKDEEAARSKLGDAVPSDGDEFDIVLTPIVNGEIVVNVTKLFEGRG